MNAFANRQEAGKLLARPLQEYADRGDVIVLGLPRGGVPVADEVARALNAKLDVLIVRKLGHPYQPELAIGAVASGGVRVLNEAIHIPEKALEELTRREERELRRREQIYREGASFPDLEDRVAILVDDGLATGSTMRAAVAAIRRMNPLRVVVAVPVAPRKTVTALEGEADEVVCLMTPSSFFGVGEFYHDFSQTSDQEVCAILERFRRRKNSQTARGST